MANVATIIYPQQPYQECRQILAILRGLSMFFLTNCQILETEAHQILKITYNIPHSF